MNNLAFVSYILHLQRGANQEPYVASIFVGLIAVILILIGNVNTLAPVVTMPFLMTYAATNYAYFKLVMCVDMRNRKKLLEEGAIVDPTATEPRGENARLVSKTEMMENLVTQDYGTNGNSEVIVDDVKFVDEKSDGCEKENPDKDILENGMEMVEKGGIAGDRDAVPGTLGDVLEPQDDSTSDQTKLLNEENTNYEKKNGMNVLSFLGVFFFSFCIFFFFHIFFKNLQKSLEIHEGNTKKSVP